MNTYKNDIFTFFKMIPPVITFLCYQRKKYPMTKFILCTLLLSLHTAAGFGIEDRHPRLQADRDSTIRLFFHKGDTKLYAQKGIVSLARLIAGHKEDLTTGRAVLRVDGYCSSYASPAKNRDIAHERSRQLKSYLIIQHGLREEHFVTRNHTASPSGQNDPGVTVRLIITPTPRQENTVVPANQPPRLSISPVSRTPGSFNRKPVRRPFHFAVKTNLLLDLATVANLGVELQITPKITTDIPVLFSPYKIKTTYQLRVLAFQPEIRYWFHDAFAGSFLGLHANIGWFNIALNDKTRYQDEETVYGGGISYGYTYLFSPRWGMEFNIGGGYMHIRYATYYNIPKGARNNTYTLNYWGITRLGVNLRYKF